MEVQTKATAKLNSGDIIAYIRKGWIAKIFRKIRGREIDGAAIYLEINGTPVIFASVKGRLNYVYFDKWDEFSRSILIARSVYLKRPYMIKLLHALGSRESFISFLSGISDIATLEDLEAKL